MDPPPRNMYRDIKLTWHCHGIPNTNIVQQRTETRQILLVKTKSNRNILK